MNKLKTSGFAALLAFVAMSFFIAYSPLPDQMAKQPERTLPVSQIAPLVVPSAAQATGSIAAPGNAGAEPDSDVEQPQASPVPAMPHPAPSAPAVQHVQQSEAAALPDEPEVVSRGLIFLDPGHQRRGNSQLEPVSPGSKERKAKVTGGTTGVATGKPEYVLNLEIAVLLKQALIQQGFEVQMTREEHDVDISNVERAEMANAANAQLAIRIHADGNESPKAKGFSVLYPDARVEATQSIQPASQHAAEAILEALKAGTTAASRGMVARSDLTGFNWSQVPVVLIELGFMTNPTEDELMSDPEYQQQMVDAITTGIDTYMLNKGD
ncbi:N-acetylmuramoyl-L-alanine amidase family protein [Paenibacillus agricola]|uniref:N-acetylmuramoyl-L-alanine amidase n=1 Tax=Paenibacillus agricola TaxID=2716264 RepID=A0ABX0J178_9BACL|nr:N-acetylmuramoyl-L-alanine amidase [Paenibacillus agricola]NHN29191.1 N-acetylmuramoyl-L-alanine amidase [Paenibacillus agricola]